MLQVLGRRVEDHIFDHELINQRRPPETVSTGPVMTDTPSLRHQPFLTPSPMSRQTEATADYPTRFEQTLAPLHKRRSSWPYLQRHELPPHDLLSSLVDLYFKHINPWSPILDRQATFDILATYSNMSEPNQVLMLAIANTTLRFSHDPRLTPDFSRQISDSARQTVQLHALHYPSVKSLQALLIMAVDVLGGAQLSLGFDILSLLANIIVQLGLCQERSSFLAPPVSALPSAYTPSYALVQPASWTEDEERRRLFWMLYALDRYACVATTTMDFVLSDAEVDRALPCRYDLFSGNKPVETKWFRSADSTEAVVNHPQNLGSFSYHCEVLRILSRIHRFLRQTIDINSLAEVNRWRETYRILDSDLNHWLHSLPGEYGKISQLCHSDPGSRISNWIMLHASFVTCVIRLHSAAAYPTSRSHIFTASHIAVQRCLSAVESLREIAQDVVSGSMLDLLGPPFAFSLWISARLLLVHAATTESNVDMPKMLFFLTTLESMGQRWEIAQIYADTLKRVLYCASAQEQEINTHCTQFTLMRGSAHDLSLLSTGRTGSLLTPPTTRVLTQFELDALSIFDFFNYPRLSPYLLQQNLALLRTNVNVVHGASSSIVLSPQQVRGNDDLVLPFNRQSVPVQDQTEFPSFIDPGNSSSAAPYVSTTPALQAVVRSAPDKSWKFPTPNPELDWLTGRTFTMSRGGAENGRDNDVELGNGGRFNPPHD